MKVVNYLKIITNSVVDIIYPNNCTICSKSLYGSESFLCLSCRYDLPYIDQSEHSKLALKQIFWGALGVSYSKRFPISKNPENR